MNLKVGVFTEIFCVCLFFFLTEGVGRYMIEIKIIRKKYEKIRKFEILVSRIYFGRIGSFSMFVWMIYIICMTFLDL